jgi:hypothetical protein
MRYAHGSDPEVFVAGLVSLIEQRRAVHAKKPAG